METSRNELNFNKISSVTPQRVSLNNAKVVKRTLAPNLFKKFNEWKNVDIVKVVLLDPKLGATFISGTSTQIHNLHRDDTVSGEINITGVGDPSEKFPEPILFAKLIRGKSGKLEVK